MWKLPLLPRIAQFFWKCLLDILKTRDKLVYAIQDGNFGCPLYSQTLETSSHGMLHCNISRAVWFVVLGLQIQGDTNLVDWLTSWFDKLSVNQIQQEDICKIAIVAWCLWNTRYEIVFKGSKISVDSIIHRCKLEIELLQNKTSKLSSQTPKLCRINLHWDPPPLYAFKINVDGSFQYDIKNGGVGLIVRDFAGTHRGSKCIYLETAWSPEHVECKSLWEAVKWAEKMQLVKVYFELDSQIAADAVNKDSMNVDLRIQNLLLDIKSIFSRNISWRCNYVPKEKNKIVDILSKFARVSYISSVWLTSIPESILYQLQEDAEFVNSEI
ncbi:uncharacterized protein LOC113340530 [Papaver somniferum]|uniref:uncharacterized protein LOC113340530 n=1 Tax=Papaver somniferum TaxID=3469 RepID=UPI000E700DDA|nr:uncharacterized protein LOC113340530 [Papaver somniferum]